ncbi:hypothetical protein ACFWG0_27185 [Streptomyces yangpuensis]|uniref:hypothetical protein n=1 Tax=Streptomyces yangpuensis TaxID=1648182 RepID=UPI0036564135
MFSDPSSTHQQPASWQPWAEPDYRVLLEQAHERISQLEKGRAAGEREHTELRQRIDRLERQLSKVLAASMNSRTDLAGPQHSDHQALAQRTKRLIEQDIHPFARRYAERCGELWAKNRHQRTPYLVGQLSRLLFAEIPAAPHSIVRTLGFVDSDGYIEASLQSLHTQVSQLAADIRAAGLRHEWDFSFTAGRPLAPERQEAWPACSPHAVPAFLMAPGYVVDGRVYGLQIVYTE